MCGHGRNVNPRSQTVFRRRAKKCRPALNPLKAHDAADFFSHAEAKPGKETSTASVCSQTRYMRTISALCSTALSCGTTCSRAGPKTEEPAFSRKQWLRIRRAGGAGNRCPRSQHIAGSLELAGVSPGQLKEAIGHHLGLESQRPHCHPRDLRGAQRPIVDGCLIHLAREELSEAPRVSVVTPPITRGVSSVSGRKVPVGAVVAAGTPLV